MRAGISGMGRIGRLALRAVVVECTGKFLTPETLQGHLDRGAKCLIVAAPVKVGDGLRWVMG